MLAQSRKHGTQSAVISWKAYYGLACEDIPALPVILKIPAPIHDYGSEEDHSVPFDVRTADA